MIIPIVYPSAVQFWLNNDLTVRAGYETDIKDLLVSLPTGYKLYTKEDVIQRVLDRYCLKEPLTLMAANPNERRKTKLIDSICQPGALPPNAFVEIERLIGTGCRVFVASPELCFLQAASKLTFLELIKLGYDLCAMYRVDETAIFQHKSRIPPLTVARLGGFLKQATGVAGAVKARQVLKYIRDCSNSPMETKLTIQQVLPFVQGGFSLGGQILNGEILFSDAAAAILKRKSCHVDTLWEKEKIAMEYDSNQTHLTPDQHDLDKRRASALMFDGYKVFTVTADMVRTVSELEKTFLSIRKKLGKRTSPDTIAATRIQREDLMKRLNEMFR